MKIFAYSHKVRVVQLQNLTRKLTKSARAPLKAFRNIVHCIYVFDAVK